MHITAHHFLAATLLTLACTCASAAVVETSNGDRLVGEISSRDESFIHVTSPLFGEVNVPVANVTKIIEDKPESDTMAKNPPPPPPPQPAKHPKPRKTWAESVFGRLDVFPNWKSNLNVGLSYLSGQTDSHNSSVAFDTERKWTDDELRFELLQQYEVTTDDDGTDDVSQDSLKVLGRYRHNISKRMFLLSETQYSYNNVKGIDEDIRESLGLGWRIVKGERLNITLSPAMTLQHQVIEGDTLDLTYAPTLFEELTFDWTKGTSIRQEASVLYPANNSDEIDPSYHFSAALKHMLSHIISLNLVYTYDYDGSVEDGVEAGQQAINLMLGVSF